MERQKEKPETIENQWDILYRDYPEIYDEFAAVPKTPSMIDMLRQEFDLKDKLIVDIGSGSGLSSIDFAPGAKKVIGIELEDAMREVAQKNAKNHNVSNVEFLKGDAMHIPLPDNSADVVTAVTLAIHPPEGFREFAKEAIRITKNGGLILMENIAPGWYGGELNDVIQDPDTGLQVLDRIMIEEFGFEFKDYMLNQEYGSMDKILRTYGFIFGKRAIEYLKAHHKTAIQWKIRVHYKYVEK